MNNSNNQKVAEETSSQVSSTLRVLPTESLFPILCIGAFCMFVSWLTFFFTSLQPTSFLFYLNARYWSIDTFAFLWLIAIWLVSEVLDLDENYHQIIRYIAGVACLFLIIRVFNSSSTMIYSSAIIVVAGCVLRSIVLFYGHFRGQIEDAGMEEVKWFWGMTCFMVAALLVAGMMQIISVRIEVNADYATSESLWRYFCDEFWQTVRNGDGAISVRLCCFLAFLAFLAFAFTIYKWVVSFISKIREE